MWVKICGNTNLDDCLLAADLGADALGFIFAESKRQVTVDQVSAIVAQLPQHLEKIGVFTTQKSGDLRETARTTNNMLHMLRVAGLTGIQLHGDLDFPLLENLGFYFADGDPRCRIIQVLPWWRDFSAEEQQESFASDAQAIARDGSADALLIDSRTLDASGGTGVPFDWVAAKDALAGVNYRTVIAGGLTPDNVGDAITALQPWGVDVVSGVEASPGRKSPEKLRAFLQRARQFTEKA